jgi:hypothetical protein
VTTFFWGFESHVLRYLSIDNSLAGKIPESMTRILQRKECRVVGRVPGILEELK